MGAGELRRGAAVLVVLGLASGAAMAVAAWLLIAPDVSPPPRFPFQDKAFHFICFGGLTAPGVLALGRRHMWFWLAHMLMLGAAIEVVQAMGGSGRQASVWDFLADAAGVTVAAFLGRMIRRRYERPDVEDGSPQG